MPPRRAAALLALAVLLVVGVAWAVTYPLSKPPTAQQSNLWARVEAAPPSPPAAPGDTVEVVADGQGHLFADATLNVPDGGFPVVLLDGGVVTANQGLPNAGGALSWPVADLVAETDLASIELSSASTATSAITIATNTGTTATNTGTTATNTGLSAPASRAVAVTPSDVTVLAATNGIFVGSAGDVAVVMLNNPVACGAAGAIVFHATPSGVALPIQVTKVCLTNTTASNLVALSP